MREGRFSFADFYMRRIKRLLPLTFLVVVATVGVGQVILLNEDFAKLIESAFATATFWANIFFWRDGGYFGAPDKVKPLLHMWSLAVEEQFYIMFPALFWLFIVRLRLRPAGLLVAVSALTLISLGVYLGLRQFGGDSPAFFLMPTRAWQLGCGVLAALIVAGGWRRDNATLSALALTVMAFSFFFADKSFPSEIVVACSAAIYLATTRGAFSLDKVLAAPVMTYLGRRSFSLYLWHWPIVAFLNYAFVGETPLAWKLGSLALILVLSELGFQLVEKPFRYRLPLRVSISFIASCCALVIAMNVFSNKRNTDGLSERLAAQVQTNYRCGISDYVAYGSSRACVLKKIAPSGNVAIMGNSHAQMYADAILDLYKDKPAGVLLIPLNSCTPTPHVNVSPRCAQMAATNLNVVLADDTISTVFIGTTYGHEVVVQSDGTVIEDPRGEHFTDALLDLINSLKHEKEMVYLIGPIQTPGYNLPSELARQLKFGWISEIDAKGAFEIPRSIFDLEFSDTIIALSKKLGSEMLRPDIWLCDADHCRFADENGSYFADSNHLSHYGIDTVRPMFEAVQPLILP
ncbi:acyltransferase family protein [Actibacterium sp. D379-3]